MRQGRAGYLLSAVLAVSLSGSAAMASPTVPTLPAGAAAEPIGYDAVPGWATDDHGPAFAAFLVSCRAIVDETAALRVGLPAEPALAAICAAALAEQPTSPAAIRAFFERHFEPLRIRGPSGGGFFTAYYEPEVDGSLVPTETFATPLLARPPDLVTLSPGEAPAGLDGLSAARRRDDGGLEAYPDREAIETGALDHLGLARAYVADPVERFFMQVQGSGRLRLADGRTMRVSYAGRNGHPYTPIGRVVADREGVPRPQMTMQRLKAFLARDPAVAREVMRENRSFVFFAVEDLLDPTVGPTGGQGVPLTAGRSLAVDRSVWPYGLPVQVSTELPGRRGAEPFARLMIAQDTGTAIVGPARGDLFLGSGEAAGRVAGAVRAEGEFIVLWPRRP